MKKALLLLLCAISCAACSAGSGPVVAEVNGEKIYASDVKNTLALEKDKYDEALAASPASMAALARTSLDELIQETLLLTEAKRLKIRATSDELNAELKTYFGTSDRGKVRDILQGHVTDADYWIKKQQRKLAIKKLITQEVVEKIPVTEEQIKNYYTAHQKDFQVPTQYHARQILVDNRILAEDLATRLAKGEDFAELAKKYSSSPDSARGGDLGYFSARDFPQVFSDICSDLALNQTSAVKETDYGFQIFQLLDKKPPRTLSVDEVHAQIVSSLRETTSADAFATWFNALKKQGRIAIHEDALKEVTPHAAPSSQS
jgi:peptidyl-prolyl cis-trans isomerase C